MLSFVMLSGFLPFSHDSKPALFELIRRGDFEFPSPWWDDVSPEAKVCVCVCVCIQRERERYAKQRFSATRNILTFGNFFCQDLINNLLIVDAKKRFSVDQCLHHPWIQNEVFFFFFFFPRP